jgi:hypothetical protein
MSRRRRQQQAAVTADRLGRLKQLRIELAEAAGIEIDNLSPSDKVRIETAVWLQLSLENSRTRILQGEPLDPTTLERVANALRELLPPANEELVVKLVTSSLCPKCEALAESEAKTLEQAEREAAAESVANHARASSAPLCAHVRVPKMATDASNAGERLGHA